MPDDYGNDSLSATPVLLDTPVTGYIEDWPDSDWFSIELEAGQTYWFDVTTDDPDGRPEADVLSPDGDRLSRVGELKYDWQYGWRWSYSTQPQPRVEVTADQTGTYFIAIDSRYVETSTYGLIVTEIPPLIDDEGDADDPYALTSGETYVGVIDFEGDGDVYAVNLPENTYLQYSVRLVAAGGYLATLDVDVEVRDEYADDPYQYLYDLDGTVMTYIPDAPGEYWISVSNQGGTRTDPQSLGSYEIWAEVVEITDPAPLLVQGTDAADSLVGFVGDDTILGFAGDDTAVAYTGNDLLHGGQGADWLEGGGGNDTAYGGKGADRIYGDNGDDLLDGNLWHDDLSGGMGNDTLLGGSGNDYLSGDEGFDRLEGQDGNDTLNGDWDSDSLFGGDGDDSLDGGNDDDLVYGGAGDDSVAASAGNDLTGLGLGNDSYGNARHQTTHGDDTVFGGAGDDSITEGDGNDDLRGQGGFDTLSGGVGDDVIFGGDQADVIYGGQGADTVYGGYGADRVELGAGADLWLDIDQAQFGNDSVNGGDGNDLLRYIAGDDTMTGGAGADLFIFETGNLTITDLGRGNDTLRIDETTFGGPLTQERLDAAAGIEDGHLVLSFDNGSEIALTSWTGTDGLLGLIDLA